MRKAESAKQLQDAVDLLVMLEQLSDHLAQGEGAKLPLAGMRITLAQARSLVQQTLESAGRREDARETVADEPPARAVSSLAGRIQKAPTAGRLRELVQPQNGTDRSAAKPLSRADEGQP